MLGVIKITIHKHIKISLTFRFIFISGRDYLRLFFLFLPPKYSSIGVGSLVFGIKSRIILNVSRTSLCLSRDIILSGSILLTSSIILLWLV